MKRVTIALVYHCAVPAGTPCSPTGPREDHQTIGVSGGPASTGGAGSSSPQPALATTLAAVVTAASAVVTVVTVNTNGTISSRAFCRGLRT